VSSLKFFPKRILLGVYSGRISSRISSRNNSLKYFSTTNPKNSNQYLKNIKIKHQRIYKKFCSYDLNKKNSSFYKFYAINGNFSITGLIFNYNILYNPISSLFLIV